MASVSIKSIGEQNILSDDNFKFIKDNLNRPLQLNSIDWFDDGKVCSITVFRTNGRDRIITLFPSSNELEYEVTL